MNFNFLYVRLLEVVSQFCYSVVFSVFLSVGLFLDSFDIFKFTDFFLLLCLISLCSVVLLCSVVFIFDIVFLIPISLSWFFFLSHLNMLMLSFYYFLKL